MFTKSNNVCRFVGVKKRVSNGIISTPLANKPWDSAIRDFCLRIADAREGINAPLNLNIVFQVPGNMLKAYQQQLMNAGLVSSMSRKGMPYDNAVMESFFSSLKQELTHHERFKDRDAARAHIFEYIESFYNRLRLHSSLDYRSPETYERMAEVTN